MDTGRANSGGGVEHFTCAREREGASGKSHLGRRTAPAQRARRAVCVLWTLPDPVRRSCIDGERHPLRRRLLSNGQPRCIDQSAFARLLRPALGLLDEAGTEARASSANSAWPQRLGAGHTRPPRTLPRLELRGRLAFLSFPSPIARYYRLLDFLR